MTAPKWGTAEDFYYRVLRNLFAVSDTLLLHRLESLRRRGITVPRNSLARCNARHLRILRSVQFIFVGPICNNVLTNRATLSCRTLRKVTYICSSSLSVNCEKAEKDTLW